MKGTIVLVLSWLAAAVSLYLCLVAVELYWNLYDWRPIVDCWAAGLGGIILLLEIGIGLLSRARANAVLRGVSLSVGLIFIGLAIYLFPAEPLTQGVFARSASSPAWYRAGRSALLALPVVFWMVAVVRQGTRANGAHSTGSKKES